MNKKERITIGHNFEINKVKSTTYSLCLCGLAFKIEIICFESYLWIVKGVRQLHIYPLGIQ